MAVPEPGAELPPYRAEVDADTAHGSSQEQVTYLSITKMAAYQGKSLGAPLGALLQGQQPRGPTTS